MKTDFQNYLTTIGEIGFVERVVSSLIYAEGLPAVRDQEMVIFETGDIGQVVGFNENAVEIVGFSKNIPRVGTKLVRTGRLIEIPVGREILGSIINPLGHSLYTEKPVYPKETRPYDNIPLGIGERSTIKKPCESGIAMVDLMIPLGRGQRELIIGDQKTGKSSFLLDVISYQVSHGSIGVYAVIGKGQTVIRHIEEELKDRGVFERTVLVASSGDDSAGMIFLTPYAAMTIAEYFRDLDQDVVLVLDDLSTHAKVYREISLLGRKFPGRNSYPGDIFYTHARLLERAGNFVRQGGEVSITCFPVVETVDGDMSGYIQTNIMSMTDGHIFFDRNLFAAGRRPAINPFLSVTRVGRQTQTPLRHEIGRTLTTFLREADKLHTFASFGAELGEHIRRTLFKEDKILKFFDQATSEVIPTNVQILLCGILWGELWNDKTNQEFRGSIKKIVSSYILHNEFKKRVDILVAGCRSLKDLVDSIKDFDLFPEDNKKESLTEAI